MKFPKGSEKWPLYGTALTVLAISVLAFRSADETALTESAFLRSETAEDEPRFTVNFPDVSIIEFMKFISKIGNVNFVYDEEELNFTVSMVSEEDTSLSNMMAILIQVLRINGFNLLEQEGNFVVHKNPRITEIPTVISNEHPLKGPHIPPLVTRIFAIKNGNPLSIAQVVTPLLSQQAIVEVSPETRHLIVVDVSTNIEKVAAILLSLDAPQASLDFDSFQARHSSAEMLSMLANQILTPISEGNPLVFVPQAATNSIYIVSTPFLIEKAMATLEDLDSPPAISSLQNVSADNILLYKVRYKSASIIMNALKAISSDIEKKNIGTSELGQAIESMRYLRQTHTILFIGTATTLQQMQQLLSRLDTPTSAQEYASDQTFYIYKIQSAPAENIQLSIESLVDKLKGVDSPSVDLIEALESMEWNKETNSLIFIGDAHALNQVRDILPNFDVSPSRSKLASSEFFLYSPRSHSGRELLRRLDEIKDNLNRANLADPALLRTLDSAKWIEESHAVLFTGDAQSIDRVKALLNDIDGTVSPEGQTTLYIHKIKYIGGHKLEQGLQNLAETLPKTDPLRKTIETMHYIPESNSIAFRGTPAILERLKELLTTLDSSDQASARDSFLLYNTEHVSAHVLLRELHNVADDLNPDISDNEAIITAIKQAKIVAATNSIIVTGNPIVIDKVKALLTAIDSPRAGEIGKASHFFFYKPQYAEAASLKTSLESLAEDLEDSGLSAPAVLRTIQSAKVVHETNSILFTGTEESINQVKTLLTELDTPARGGVKHVGKSTFLIYKIQYADPSALMNAIRHVGHDLQKTGGSQDLVQTITHMRYVSETNSIIFTGPSETLERVYALAHRLDTRDLAKAYPDEPRMTPEGYIIYHPQNRSGPELIHILQDFEDHLRTSGFQDKELYDTIHNLKYMEKTNSVLISGNSVATQRTYELLQRFDTPGASGDVDFGKIDEMSFLIYKLQYHRGPEIESALRQMGDDLRKLKDADKHSRLINAIDSVQWLQVTNSLLSTGNEQTLSKLKQLIESVDIPLRQVFIEVLVVETELSKGVEFGLRWASQGKYKDKLGYGTGSFPNIAAANDPLSAFNTNMADISASNPPTGQSIPIGTTGGWDLGIIGDIILHKGSTYFALGSLVDALQTDTDSTIVLNQKLITQDNKNSNLFVGQNIPFTGSTLFVTGGASNSTSANLEYRDIGVSLSITPLLGDDDVITMEIDQEITEVETPGNFVSPSAVTGITTSKTNTQTTVSMPNKHFLVLSGMIRNTTTRSKTSIPCLGGLPLIGAAFSQNQKVDAKKNVIIFLRPHIVNSYAEYKEVTARQEDIYRSQAPAEDFDASLEIVKTPDDG